MQYDPTRLHNVLVYTFHSGCRFAWYVVDNKPIPLLEGTGTYTHTIAAMHNVFAGYLIHILEQWPERASKKTAETIQALVRNQLPSDPISDWEKIVFGEISEIDCAAMLAQLKANHPDYWPVIASMNTEAAPEYISFGAYRDWQRSGGSEH